MPGGGRGPTGEGHITAGPISGIYANPFSHRVEYFRLKALDIDRRCWLLPRDAGDTFWWTYLDTDLPTRALKFVE